MLEKAGCKILPYNMFKSKINHLIEVLENFSTKYRFYGIIFRHSINKKWSPIVSLAILRSFGQEIFLIPLFLCTHSQAKGHTSIHMCLKMPVYHNLIPSSSVKHALGQSLLF